ncbi:MAG TPA: hypothetical protein VFC03_03005, partial [Acidimicrobiales bacterium]|nr:hypothetical protein [Acidimicrobiales bacterium]
MVLEPEPVLVTDPTLMEVLAELRAREPLFHLRELGTTSGTFLASGLLSGECAGQPLFSWWLGVLPKSSPWGVFVEFEECVQSGLGGVGVAEDALGSGSAFVPGGVEQDG